MPRIKTPATGWEARRLPLCHAAPPTHPYCTLGHIFIRTFIWSQERRHWSVRKMMDIRNNMLPVIYCCNIFKRKKFYLWLSRSWADATKFFKGGLYSLFSFLFMKFVLNHDKQLFFVFRSVSGTSDSSCICSNSGRNSDSKSGIFTFLALVFKKRPCYCQCRWSSGGGSKEVTAVAK